LIRGTSEPSWVATPARFGVSLDRAMRSHRAREDEEEEAEDDEEKYLKGHAVPDDCSDGCSDDDDDNGRFGRPTLCLALLALGAIVAAVWSLLRGRPAVGVANAWRQCSGQGRVGGPVRDLHVHFLAMAIEDLPHADIWNAFFAGAPSGSYSAWVHCKYPDKCKENFAESGLTAFTIVPAVFGEWCTDLLSPMLQLLRYALAQQVFPPGAPAKFVFISDLTLPLKPLSVIRAELGKHPFASDFCIFPSHEWFPLKTDNSTWRITASQWSVLAKEDAETMVNVFPQPSPDNAVQVPKVENTSWDDFEVSHCIDEGAVFSALFGLFHTDKRATTANPYPGIGPVLFNSIDGIEQGCCRTWGFQMGHVSPEVDRQIVAHWEQTSQLGFVLKELIADSESDIRAPVTNWNEILYVVDKLGSAGLRALRQSSFLVGRKFAANSSFPGFAEVMFAE